MSKSDYIKNVLDFKTAIIILLIISLIGMSYYFKASNDESIDHIEVGIDEILKDQNEKGNVTLYGQNLILTEIERNSNASYKNQETYFKPYFNDSFSKIFDALNITNK